MTRSWLDACRYCHRQSHDMMNVIEVLHACWNQLRRVRGALQSSPAADSSRRSNLRLAAVAYDDKSPRTWLHDSHVAISIAVPADMGLRLPYPVQDASSFVRESACKVPPSSA